MAFNSAKYLILSLSVLSIISACTPSKVNLPDVGAENMIGIPLSQNSKLQSSTEDDSDKIVVFDKTIRKVHYFDLQTSSHLGLYSVENPTEDHFLIYGNSLDYFIDMSKKHLSIQKIGGEKQDIPLKFVGTPVSASFDVKQGYLVVYDHLQSVMIVKLDKKGNVLAKPFISGPVIESEGTIQAGDIFGNGKLILSIRGNVTDATTPAVDYILSVDIEQTISEQNTTAKLIGDKITTNLTEMSWLAPVLGAPHLALVRSTGKVSLVDLSTKTTLASLPTEDWVVEKYSKIKDAHVVLRKKYDYYPSSAKQGNLERRIFYVDSGTLKMKALTKNYSFVLNSHLDIKNNLWSVVKSDNIKEYEMYNSFNGDYKKRTFTRLRISDLLSTDDIQIDDNAIIEISGNFLFSLFPSELGYATKTNIETNKKSILRNFNIKYMQ